MLSIAGSTKIQMEEVLYDMGYIKAGEEPSTLVDQVPIIIFDRKKKILKTKSKIFKEKVKKSRNNQKNINSSPKKQNKEKLPDPLSPFAVLKSMKIR